MKQDLPQNNALNNSTDKKSRATLTTKRVVLIGMLSASITSGKLVLSAIPNVEIVTLLIMAYTIVFGLSISLPTTLIFVTTEMLIYGLNTWVLAYYIHWCMIAIVTAIVKSVFGNNKLIPYIITACLITACFGVLTSLIDVLFFIKSNIQTFWSQFAIMYVRGISFYIIHIISTTTVVALGLLPITTILKKLSKSYFKG